MTVLEIGNPTSRCQQGWFLWRPLYPHRPFLHVRMPWYLFLFGRAPALQPHLSLITFLKALSPNTVTLGVRTLRYEFWEDTIQSTALDTSAAVPIQHQVVTAQLSPTGLALPCDLGHSLGPIGSRSSSVALWERILFSVSPKMLNKGVASKTYPAPYSITVAITLETLLTFLIPRFQVNHK